MEGGHSEEAESLIRGVVGVDQRIVGPEHPDTLQAERYLSDALRDAGRFPESEQLGRSVLNLQRRVEGSSHPDTLLTLTSLARTLSAEGKLPEAESLAREALGVHRGALGLEHRATLGTEQILLAILVREGRFADAETLGRATLQTALRVLHPGHPMVPPLQYSLAAADARQGRREEALSLLSDAIGHGLPPDLARGMETDANLASLRADPRFAALVVDAGKTASAGPQALRLSSGARRSAGRVGAPENLDQLPISWHRLGFSSTLGRTVSSACLGERWHRRCNRAGELPGIRWRVGRRCQEVGRRAEPSSGSLPWSPRGLLARALLLAGVVGAPTRDAGRTNGFSGRRLSRDWVLGPELLVRQHTGEIPNSISV